MVSIVSRSAWGATPWKSGVKRVAISEKTEFLVHYHGGRPPASRGVAVPRNIEKIHLANGWSGIGYNFAVDLDGKVYEGRGWDGVGSQCPGHNRSGIGVYVAIGGDQKPTAAALRSVRALYDEACRKTGRTLRKMGHRDGIATACPGEHLYAWVKAGMPAPGGSTSAPAPSKPTAPKPSAPAPSNDSTLRRGVRSARVKLLQSALNRVFPGYSKLKADGVFGPATEKVVKEFQRRSGLAADGKVGPATRSALARHGIRV